VGDIADDAGTNSEASADCLSVSKQRVDATFDKQSDAKGSYKSAQQEHDAQDGAQKLHHALEKLTSNDSMQQKRRAFNLMKKKRLTAKELAALRLQRQMEALRRHQERQQAARAHGTDAREQNQDGKAQSTSAPPARRASLPPAQSSIAANHVQDAQIEQSRSMDQRLESNADINTLARDRFTADCGRSSYAAGKEGQKLFCVEGACEVSKHLESSSGEKSSTDKEEWLDSVGGAPLSSKSKDDFRDLFKSDHRGLPKRSEISPEVSKHSGGILRLELDVDVMSDRRFPPTRRSYHDTGLIASSKASASLASRSVNSHRECSADDHRENWSTRLSLPSISSQARACSASPARSESAVKHLKQVTTRPVDRK